MAYAVSSAWRIFVRINSLSSAMRIVFAFVVRPEVLSLILACNLATVNFARRQYSESSSDVQHIFARFTSYRG